MDRRSFLRGLTGIIVGAPAIVSASSLMKLVVPKQEIILLDEFYGGEWFEERLPRLAQQLKEASEQADRDYINNWIGGFVLLDENGILIRNTYETI